MKLIVDVREPNEYAAGHVVGAMNLPLSSFDDGAAAVAAFCKTGMVELVCKSGMRANQAKDRLLKQFPDLADRVTAGVGDGAVAKAGGPAIPIIRQVLMIAGTLVAGFGLVAAFVNPAFVWGAVAVGAGLTFAGATGICGMAMVLEKMPWNQRAAGAN